MNRSHIIFWTAVLLAAIVALFGLRWMSSHRAAPEARAAALPQSAPASMAAAIPAGREYVLEVVSLGVTLDRYRQGALWEALRTGHPQATIREQDPKKYEWGATDKNGIEGGRQGHSLENGLKFTPTYWGVPVFDAMPPSFNEAFADMPDNPRMGFGGSGEASGMAWHLVLAGPRRLDEHPERLLQDVFDFFDAHPEVPYVVLCASDGAGTRDDHSADGSPQMLRDGHYVTPMPDSSVLLVLARRERVDAMRKYAWSEPFDEGRTRKLFEYYVHLERSVPKPEGLFARTPTVEEWLAATPRFIARDDIYPRTFSARAAELNPLAPGRPPASFKPTPWFPLPWNKHQLETFDRLPTLGFIHRPVYVPLVDEEGRPLARREARAAALAAGWQQALQTLPEAERRAAPARVVAATGGSVAQKVALHSVLDGWAEQGGPQLDPGRPEQWIDTDARLGNTGAATWFMQMAIGVMGSYREGGTTAAINLRNEREASIVFVTPPAEDKRRSQQHPHGGDVLRHHSAPAIDPANYGQR